MEKANVSRALLAGFVATLVMTMMMYAAPRMGMPKMDIAAMLGSMLNGGQMPAPMSGPWIMPDLVALFRLYNPFNGDHFYTANTSERGAGVAGGYVSEGVAGFVLTQPGTGRRALYRAYNPVTGQHRFTGDQAEYNALPSPWIKEGVAAHLVATP